MFYFDSCFVKEREATTYAVTQGVAEIADFVTKRMQHAEELLQERHKEQKKLSKSKRLTFNQKVIQSINPTRMLNVDA